MYARQADAAGWLGLTARAAADRRIAACVGCPSLLYYLTRPFDSVTAFLLGIALILGLLLTMMPPFACVFQMGRHPAGWNSRFFSFSSGCPLAGQVVGVITTILGDWPWPGLAFPCGECRSGRFAAGKVNKMIRKI
jgi:hypothetical protein